MTQPNSTGSLLDDIETGLMAACVSLLCLLIPVVHLVAGPLGPLIGAFLMTLRTPTSPRGVIVVGVTVGSVLAGVASLALGLMFKLSLPGHNMPAWLAVFLAPPAVALTVGTVWVIASALAVTGAACGARINARRSEASVSL